MADFRWKDQIWEHPRRYRLQQNADGTVDVIPEKGQSMQDGTPVNAENLNKFFDIIPQGLISMWSGSITSIPEGWALCDGNNGTPDLRNRFIVGAGGEYSVGNKGGVKEVTLTEAQMPIHKHSISLSGGGSHAHRMEVRFYDGENVESSGSGRVPGTRTREGKNEIRTDTDGYHTHDITMENMGGGKPHENRPPYYALAFIMKL